MSRIESPLTLRHDAIPFTRLSSPTLAVAPPPAARVAPALGFVEPHPDAIYRADDPSGAWTVLERSQQGQPYTIFASTDKLGYFAAGYVASSPPPGAVTVGGGQTLPIIVAVLIVVVVLAGLPLAVMRRRRSAGGGEGDEEGEA